MTHPDTGEIDISSVAKAGVTPPNTAQNEPEELTGGIPLSASLASSQIVV